jgi:hypothetical protein
MFFTKIFIILAILLSVASLKAQTAIYDGDYVMYLEIGDKIFEDKLTFAGVNSPISFLFRGPVQGFVEVPGVFKSPLTGEGLCKPWSNYCNFKFSILAKENGEEFEVFYEMRLYSGVLTDGQLPTFEGQAFLKDHQLLGHFTAVKQNE